MLIGILLAVLAAGAYLYFNSGSTGSTGTTEAKSTVQPTAPKFNLTSKQTNFSSGPLNITSLSNLNLNCGDKSALNSLNLSKNIEGTQIQYNYKCNSANDIGVPINKQTNKGELWGIVYLDRHNIECGSNQAINQLQLTSDSSGYGYNYTCVDVPNLKCSEPKKTIPIPRTENVLDLTSQNISCNENEVIKQLKFKPENDKFYYEYTCCSK